MKHTWRRLPDSDSVTINDKCKQLESGAGQQLTHRLSCQKWRMVFGRGGIPHRCRTAECLRSDCIRRWWSAQYSKKIKDPERIMDPRDFLRNQSQSLTHVCIPNVGHFGIASIGPISMSSLLIWLNYRNTEWLQWKNKFEGCVSKHKWAGFLLKTKLVTDSSSAHWRQTPSCCQQIQNYTNHDIIGLTKIRLDASNHFWKWPQYK